LKLAGISGALGVSQFMCHFGTNVWRTFCELQGPLTNTLYHGASEVGMSLYNFGRIGGLSILGAIHEKFLPRNKDLTYHNKYPAIVVELLCIHAELKSSLDLKKWEADQQVKVDLVKAGFSELQDFEKEKDHLKNLTGSIISFNDVWIFFHLYFHPSVHFVL